MLDSTGTTTEKHYIGDFAVVTRTSPIVGAGNLATNYLHRDNLGSVDAITDEAGTVIQRMSFDAWGKRRETNWTPLSETAIVNFNTTITNRGFTGHEQLDSVGLVHMNGRVYDAELGRFLSADPHVQETHNLQNWNRYSYVLNNPLSYTDPTGFFFKKLFRAVGKFFKKVFKAIGRVLKKALRNPIVRAIIQIIACANPAGVTCAAVSAGLAAASGGSVAEILQAAVFAFVMPRVWKFVGSNIGNLNPVGQALVHGVVNGAATAARGGRFLAGFATGVLGKLTGFVSDTISQGNMYLDTAIVAAAGCAGAVIAKGSCANGAISAAFANMYNKYGDKHYGMVQTNTGTHFGVFREGANGELFDITGEFAATYGFGAAGASPVAQGISGGFNWLKGLFSGRSLGTNPFKGKNASQINKMFQKKGFKSRGPDPKNGKGDYLNPKTNRPYHNDANHPPGKPPHVSVGRPENNPLARHKLPRREYNLD